MLRVVVLTQYRLVTDGQTDGRKTDGIAVASTALAERRAVKNALLSVFQETLRQNYCVLYKPRHALP